MVQLLEATGCSNPEALCVALLTQGIPPFSPMDRRTFTKLAAAGVAGAPTLNPAFSEITGSTQRHPPNTSNLKLSMQTSVFNEEQVTWARYLGIEYLTMWVPGTYTYEDYLGLTEAAERQGVKIGPCSSISNHQAVVLGLPGRDEVIEQYKASLRAMGRAGLDYRTVSFMANGVVSTEVVEARGGAPTRSFTEGKPRDPELSYAYQQFDFEREYTEEELWDNYAYFIRAVAPVAEEAGVRIGIHPEDPPGLTLGNVPRVVASSFEGYKRALEIANSPNVGLCAGMGNVLQAGPERWGCDPIEFIHHFGAQGKIFKVHFRNVSSTMPSFYETWPDDGYYDMYLIMKALREVNNNCYIIADHWPGGQPGQYGPLEGQTYCLGYMRALLERANDEFGG